MKIMFIRTPRYLWPFNSEASSFWQPLGFACLAAAVREAGYHDVQILDCPALKLGWKSLARILENERPDLIGIGEETVSANEGYRLARLARQLLPDAKIICGGHFFTYMYDEALREHPIDFVVRFEGDLTLVELLDEIQKQYPSYSRVRGIAFREGDEVIATPPRPIIEDLDDLPLPAYDLLPMELYGRGARNHPALGALQHSRGCTASCDFCVVWRTMGQVGKNGDPLEIAPQWRTKSPERMLEEVDRLVKGYQRQTLGWVDDTWNASPEWSAAFCEAMIKRNYGVSSTMWMRADYLVRDERLGILEAQVRAGMVQCIIGIERATERDLETLSKRNNGPEITEKAISILRRRYPEVFVIGSLIYGLEDDSEESIDEIIRFVNGTGIDYAFVLALTPNPGTEVWRRARARGLIEVDDYSAYNFHTPIMPSRYLSRAELEQIYFKRLLFNGLLKPGRIAQDVLARNNGRKRRVYRALMFHGFRIVGAMLKNRLSTRLRFWRSPPPHTNYSIKPAWYES